MDGHVIRDAFWWRKLRDPQAPCNIPTSVGDTEYDRTANHSRQTVSREERKDPYGKSDIERHPQGKEVHMIEEMSPHRPESKPRKDRDHSREQRDRCNRQL